MHVCIMLGVGFHKDLSSYERFASDLRKPIPGCTTELFAWDHNPSPPINIPSVDLALESARAFVFEVLLDLQYVIRNLKTIKLPNADVYVGHSAGGILAAVSGKPAVTMGSPVQTIPYMLSETDRVEVQDIINNSDRPMLNIMCKYDLAATPMFLRDGWRVENWVVSPRFTSPQQMVPPMSHTMYWSDDRVVKKISGVLKQWEKGEVAFVERSGWAPKSSC